VYCLDNPVLDDTATVVVVAGLPVDSKAANISIDLIAAEIESFHASLE